jgi:hypothetical protein
MFNLCSKRLVRSMNNNNTNRRGIIVNGLLNTSFIRNHYDAYQKHSDYSSTVGAGLTKKQASIIAIEDKYGAHNYQPVPVVLSKGEGVYVWST